MNNLRDRQIKKEVDIQLKDYLIIWMSFNMYLKKLKKY